MNHICLIYGTPDELVTDNGGEFVNGSTQLLTNLLKIRHRQTTAYNPQANGSIEGKNRTIKDMISLFVNRFATNWDILLPMVLWSYNITINSATGYSPFRVLYGREARCPTESWVEDFEKHNSIHSIDDYVTQLTEALAFSWNIIADKTLVAQDAKDSRERDPREREFIPYTNGEQFYLKSTPKRTFTDPIMKEKHKVNQKLQMRYTGPHRITKVINPVVYEANVDGKLIIVHANKIKRDPSKRAIRHKLNPFEIFTDEIIGEMLKEYNEENKDNIIQLEQADPSRLEWDKHNEDNDYGDNQYNPPEYIDENITYSLILGSKHTRNEILQKRKYKYYIR